LGRIGPWIDRQRTSAEGRQAGALAKQQCEELPLECLSEK
jgi:hypothetical protein